MQVSGNVSIGEAAGKAARGMARLTGHPWPMIWSNVAGGVFVIVTLFLFGVLTELRLLPAWTWLIGLAVGMVGGIWLTVIVCRRLAMRTFKAALMARKVGNPLPVVIEMTDDHLINRTGEVETRMAWHVVSDVLRIDPYWVILAQGGQHYLPRRYFPDPETEKAFIAELLMQLDEDARARSDAARAFVAS